jgi:hypothetical protein
VGKKQIGLLPMLIYHSSPSIKTLLTTGPIVMSSIMKASIFPMKTTMMQMMKDGGDIDGPRVEAHVKLSKMPHKYCHDVLSLR